MAVTSRVSHLGAVGDRHLVSRARSCAVKEGERMKAIEGILHVLLEGAEILSGIMYGSPWMSIPHARIVRLSI